MSREIDALVAEKIFKCRVNWDCGFCVDGEKHENHGDKRYFCDCGHGFPHGDGKGPDLPEYSTKIVDAWAVVEKMRQDKKSFCIDVDGDGGYFRASFGRWFPQENASPSMAICLAALETIGVEVK